MSVRLLPLTDKLRNISVHEIFSDFDEFVTGDLFTSALSDSGTATISDAAGGVLAIAASDGTVADNDEGYVYGTKEGFKVAEDKTLVFQAAVKWTEANTDDANVIVGLTDAAGADLLVNNGAGPKTSGDVIGFYKVDGGTVWKVHIHVNGGTATETTTTVTAGGSAFQVLRVEVQPVSSTSAQAKFYIDGVHIVTHTFTYTGSTEVKPVVGVKNGDTNMETLNVDYIYCGQLR